MFGKKEKIFKLGLNTTGRGQIFSRLTTDSPYRVSPGGVIDTTLFNGGTDILEPVDNFLYTMEQKGARAFYIEN